MENNEFLKNIINLTANVQNKEACLYLLKDFIISGFSQAAQGFLILTPKGIFLKHKINEAEKLAEFYKKNSLNAEKEVKGFKNLKLNAVSGGYGRIIIKNIEVSSGEFKFLEAFIHKFILFHENFEKVWGAYYINEVTKAFTESLDIKEISEKLITLITDFAKVSDGFICYYKENIGLEILIKKGLNKFDNALLTDALKNSVKKHNFKEKGIYIKNNYDLNGDNENENLTEPLMVIPLIIADKEIGFISFNEFYMDKDFSEIKAAVLNTIAQQASVALNNAVLYTYTKKLSITDELTGLHNYRYFIERITEEFSRARRYGFPFSLLMIDIDNFKNFNDTYGHQAGDLVLKETARILKESIRETDLAARYGGEEFVIMLINTPLQTSDVPAERIRKKIEENKVKWRENTLNITVSIGVSNFPAHAQTKEELIKSADKALYSSKRTGKNKITIHN